MPGRSFVRATAKLPAAKFAQFGDECVADGSLSIELSDGLHDCLLQILDGLEVVV